MISKKVFYLLQDIGYKTKFHTYKSQRNISLITGDKYDIERLYSPNGTCLEVHHKILKNNKKMIYLTHVLIRRISKQNR